MDNEKMLAQLLVDKLIEMSCRAIKAEGELAACKSDEDLWHNGCIRRDAEIDALKKEVAQLKAKLNALEGTEEAKERGLL